MTLDNLEFLSSSLQKGGWVDLAGNCR